MPNLFSSIVAIILLVTSKYSDSSTFIESVDLNVILTASMAYPYHEVVTNGNTAVAKTCASTSYRANRDGTSTNYNTNHIDLFDITFIYNQPF